MNMTYKMAVAIATDTANAQMIANHRVKWNIADYNLACRKLAILFPSCGANPSAGLSTLKNKKKEEATE